MALKTGYATQVVKFDTIMKSIKQVEIEAIRNKKKLTGKDGKEKKFSGIPTPCTDTYYFSGIPTPCTDQT